MSNSGNNSGVFKIRSFATPSAFDPHHAPSGGGSQEILPSSTEFIVNGTVRGQRFPTAVGTVFPADTVPASGLYPFADPNGTGENSSAFPLYYNYKTGEIFFYYNTDALFPKPF